MSEEEEPKIAGFSVKRNEDLIIPYYIHNVEAGREVLAREAGFSFPLAVAGLVVGGPIGVVVGHITGTLVGYIRHQRIQGEL